MSSKNKNNIPKKVVSETLNTQFSTAPNEEKEDNSKKIVVVNFSDSSSSDNEKGTNLQNQSIVSYGYVNRNNQDRRQNRYLQRVESMPAYTTFVETSNQLPLSYQNRSTSFTPIKNQTTTYNNQNKIYSSSFFPLRGISQQQKSFLKEIPSNLLFQKRNQFDPAFNNNFQSQSKSRVRFNENQSRFQRSRNINPAMDNRYNTLTYSYSTPLYQTITTAVPIVPANQQVINPPVTAVPVPVPSIQTIQVPAVQTINVHKNVPNIPVQTIPVVPSVQTIPVRTIPVQTHVQNIPVVPVPVQNVPVQTVPVQTVPVPVQNVPVQTVPVQEIVTTTTTVPIAPAQIIQTIPVQPTTLVSTTVPHTGFVPVYSNKTMPIQQSNMNNTQIKNNMQSYIKGINDRKKIYEQMNQNQKNKGYTYSVNTGVYQQKEVINTLNSNENININTKEDESQTEIIYLSNEKIKNYNSEENKELNQKIIDEYDDLKTDLNLKVSPTKNIATQTDDDNIQKTTSNVLSFQKKKSLKILVDFLIKQIKLDYYYFHSKIIIYNEYIKESKKIKISKVENQNETINKKDYSNITPSNIDVPDEIENIQFNEKILDDNIFNGIKYKTIINKPLSKFEMNVRKVNNQNDKEKNQIKETKQNDIKTTERTERTEYETIRTEKIVDVNEVETVEEIITEEKKMNKIFLI